MWENLKREREELAVMEVRSVPLFKLGEITLIVAPQAMQNKLQLEKAVGVGNFKRLSKEECDEVHVAEKHRMVC